MSMSFNVVRNQCLCLKIKTLPSSGRIQYFMLLVLYLLSAALLSQMTWKYTQVFSISFLGFICFALFLFERQSFTEGRDKKRFSILWSTLQISATVRTGPVASQEPGISSGSPTGGAGAQTLEPSSVVQAHQQAARTEVKQLGTEWVPLWDTVLHRPQCRPQYSGVFVCLFLFKVGIQELLNFM